MTPIDIVSRAVLLAILALMNYATGSAAQGGDVVGVIAYAVFTLAYAGLTIETAWQFVRLYAREFCPSAPLPAPSAPLTRQQRRMRLREYLASRGKQ